MHRERKWLYCFCNTLNDKEHHKRSKRSGYSGTRPDFSVICKSSKIAPQNGQHKLDDKCPNLPSVQRGTKVATGQFLYSFICYQKKGIKMLQQYVRSNSDHSVILRKCTPGWRGYKIACKGGFFFTPPKQVTPPTRGWSPTFMLTGPKSKEP